MDSKYHDIIIQREELILDSLNWGSSLVNALEDRCVLQREDIDEIEEEAEKKSKRLKLLLRRLPQEGNRAFHGFLVVLEDLNCRELSAVLRSDAMASAKGSRRKARVTTFASYIDLMDDQIVRQLESNDLSPRERSAVVDELRTMLEDIGRFVRQNTQRKEQFRRAVLRVVDPSFGAAPAWKAPDINLLDRDGIRKWDEYETDIDQDIYEHLEAYVSELELERKKLEGELDTNSQTKVIRSSWKTDKHGKKVYVETEEAPPCEENFIHVSKHDMLQIIKVLKPHRKLSMASRSSGGSPSLQKAGEDMKEQILNISDQVDRLKDRLQQTSQRITELEREKGTVYAALEEDDLDKPLQDVVMDYVQDLKEEKVDMQGEIESLRKKIESLAAEHRSAVQAMYEAQSKAKEATENKEPVKQRPSTPVRKVSATSAAPSARSRRISAPVMNANVQRNSTATATPVVLSTTVFNPLDSPKLRPKKGSTKIRRTSAVKAQ